MTLLNVSQAARAVGKDRGTLHRYMNEGKLSFTKNGAGRVLIDTSELIRVFGELVNTSEPAINVTVEKRGNTAPRNTELLRQLNEATEHIKWLTAQLDEEKARFDEERARSAKLEEEREREREHSRELERLMLTAGTSQKKPGVLSRLFGH